MMLSRLSRFGFAMLLSVAVAAGAPSGALAEQSTATPAPAPLSAPAREILIMLKVPPEHFRPGGSYGGGYGDTASQAMRKRTARGIARMNGFTLVDGWPMPLLGVDCYVMQIGEGETIEAAIARVSRDPRVAWSEPMQLYRAPGSGDPLYPIEPAVQK
jgi:hypothetical protein